MAVIKNISYFLAASVLSKPFGFLLSFALAKVLGPTDFGVWVTLMLIVSYSPIAALGTVETLVKQVPFFRGRNESAKIKETEDSVMGSLVLAALFLILLALLGLVILPWLNLGLDSVDVSVMLLAVAVSCASNFFYHRFAAYENFKAVGMMDLLRSALALIFVGGMAWRWGLRGAAAGYFLHELSMSILLMLFNVRSHGKVGITFRPVLLSHAVRIGFPITILWWSLTLTGTVDRVVLGSLLGPLAVGHYGLGVSAAGMLGLVPMVVGRVLYPRVNKQIGRNEGANSMQRIVVAPTLALGALLANLQLAALVIMPYLYNQLLPKYQPGLLAGEVLMLGSYFSCLLRNGANYLIATNLERVFLKYIVVTLVFNVLCDVGLLKAGMGLVGVALGTSLAGLLLTSLVWYRVLLGLGQQKSKARSTLFALYLPLILLASAAIVLRILFPSAFQLFDLLTLGLGVILIIILNGLLYCFPIYRNEIKGWMTTALRLLKITA
jgi:O-antigen/teichoic acid export membrane protein